MDYGKLPILDNLSTSLEAESWFWTGRLISHRLEPGHGVGNLPRWHGGLCSQVPTGDI